jgi:2'-5' RNA ligase
MHSLDEPAPSVAPTQTAVIVPVPAAEASVAEHRRRLDHSAGWGVPAHLTVLYPFLAPRAVDAESLAALSTAIGSVDAFECTFRRTARFGTEVLWLAPEPEEPLRQLTLAVWRAFPDYPPYGGVHDDIQPHLTVAERALGGPGALDAAEADLAPRLPISQHIDHVLLIAGSTEPRSWRTLQRFQLRGATVR